MSKFKVGDRVRVIGDTKKHWHGYSIGDIVVVVTITGDYIFCTLGNWSQTLKPEQLELVNENPLFATVPDKFFDIVDFEWKQNYKMGGIIQVPAKKTNMNLITTFKNITRSEPNKTFVKAGVMNEDLTLTSEGTELFIQFMFDKHATEFKKDVVDAIIAEQEKK